MDETTQRSGEDRRKAHSDEIVHDVFEKIGFDDTIPEMRELRKDLEWARNNRKRCETLVGKVVVYAALALAGAGVATFWSGLKVKLGG